MSHILSSYNQEVKPEMDSTPRILIPLCHYNFFQGATVTDSTIHINCNTSSLASQVQGTITKNQD